MPKIKLTRLEAACLLAAAVLGSMTVVGIDLGWF